MPSPLRSRVFSSSTLLEGLGEVKAESGMDDLEGMDVNEMQEEIKRLEAYQKDTDVSVVETACIMGVSMQPVLKYRAGFHC